MRDEPQRSGLTHNESRPQRTTTESVGDDDFARSVRAGIGVNSSITRLGADRAIGHIAITHRHDTRRFIIFNYGVPEARDLVPLSGIFVTRILFVDSLDQAWGDQ